mgnify:CR=1 FL=1
MDVPDSPGTIFTVQKNDRIIMYTDGLEEATDPSGKMFGEQRFDQLLELTISQNRPLDSLLKDLKDYCQSEEQQDDITLLEIAC